MLDHSKILKKFKSMQGRNSLRKITILFYANRNRQEPMTAKKISELLDLSLRSSYDYLNAYNIILYSINHKEVNDNKG